MSKKIVLMGDFEICLMNFLGENITRKTCYFHYCQNIWRQCQAISKVEYEARRTFYLLAKYLMVFPFISVERIEKIVLDLEMVFQNENEKKLLKYYKSNYINGVYKKKNCGS